jgi:hypothetical protein
MANNNNYEITLTSRQCAIMRYIYAWYRIGNPSPSLVVVRDGITGHGHDVSVTAVNSDVHALVRGGLLKRVHGLHGIGITQDGMDLAQQLNEDAERGRKRKAAQRG